MPALAVNGRSVSVDSACRVADMAPLRPRELESMVMRVNGQLNVIALSPGAPIFMAADQPGGLDWTGRSASSTPHAGWRVVSKRVIKPFGARNGRRC